MVERLHVGLGTQKAGLRPRKPPCRDASAFPAAPQSRFLLGGSFQPPRCRTPHAPRLSGPTSPLASQPAPPHTRLTASGAVPQGGRRRRRLWPQRLRRRGSAAAAGRSGGTRRPSSASPWWPSRGRGNEGRLLPPHPGPPTATTGPLSDRRRTRAAGIRRPHSPTCSPPSFPSFSAAFPPPNR